MVSSWQRDKTALLATSPLSFATGSCPRVDRWVMIDEVKTAVLSLRSRPCPDDEFFVGGCGKALQHGGEEVY